MNYNHNNKMGYVEHVELKYVIATTSEPTEYLYRDVIGDKYVFVQNIMMASKVQSKRVAQMLRDYFYQDTRIVDLDLVIVPLKITYELVEED